MDSRKDTSPQPAAPEKCKTLSVLLAYRAPHLREVLQRPRKVIQGWGRVGGGGPGWAVNPTLAVTLAAAVRCLIHCATAGTPERKFLSKEFSVFGGTASLTSRAGSMFLEDPRVPWSCPPGPGGPSGRAASQWGMACRTPEAGGERRAEPNQGLGERDLRPAPAAGEFPEPSPSVCFCFPSVQPPRTHTQTHTPAPG